MAGYLYNKSLFSQADEPHLIELFGRLLAGEWGNAHEMARCELVPRYGFSSAPRAASSYRDLMGRMGYAVPRFRGKTKGSGSRIPRDDWPEVIELYQLGSDSMQIAQMFHCWDYPTEKRAASAVRKVINNFSTMRDATCKYTTDAMLYAGALHWRKTGELPRPSLLKLPEAEREGLHAYSTIEYRFGTMTNYWERLGYHIKDMGWCDHRPPPPGVKRGAPFFGYDDAERMHTLYRSGLAVIEIAQMVYKRFGYKSETVAANSIGRAFKHYSMPMRSRSEASREWRRRHGPQKQGMISDERARNLRTLYLQGASLIDLSDAYSNELGYRTAASCAGSISHAFKIKGWAVRGRSEANTMRGEFQQAVIKAKGETWQRPDTKTAPGQRQAPDSPTGRATAQPLMGHGQPAASVSGEATATP